MAAAAALIASPSRSDVAAAFSAVSQRCAVQSAKSADRRCNIVNASLCVLGAIVAAILVHEHLVASRPAPRLMQPPSPPQPRPPSMPQAAAAPPARSVLPSNPVLQKAAVAMPQKAAGPRTHPMQFAKQTRPGLPLATMQVAKPTRPALPLAIPVAGCKLFGSRLPGCPKSDGVPTLPMLTGAWHGNDGWGFNILEMIKMLALAHTYNLTFGGLYLGGSGHGEVMNHGVPLFSCVLAFFRASSDVLFISHNPNFAASVTAFQDCNHAPIASRCFKFEHSRRVPLTAFTHAKRNGRELIVWTSPRVDEHELSTSFMQLMHGHVLPQLEAFASMGFERCSRASSRSPLRVAIHVRREDVTVQNNPNMWEPDRVFLQQIARIRGLFPNASFHVFSSTGEWHNASSFNAFRQAGVKLHLDRPIFETIADASFADIYLNTLGTFSLIPALLSQGCVVYRDWSGHVRKLQEWVDRRWTSTLLQKCVSEAWARRQALCRVRSGALRHSHRLGSHHEHRKCLQAPQVLARRQNP